MKKIFSLIIITLFVFAANAQTIDRSIRPSSAPAKKINIKDAKTFTLKNGLKVFVVEDKTTPIMYYSLIIDVDPALQGNKTGMYDAFSDVFGSVTTNRTKEQLNKDLDLIGATGHTYRGGGYIQFLKKYEDKALNIFTDMILNPLFLQEELDLTLSKYKTALQTIGDDPGMINQRVSNALTYGSGFPYGEIETEATLDNVRLSDLEAYYNTYFAPNVARLVIVGDISEKEAKKRAEAYFGSWAKKDVPKATYTLPQMPERNQVAFVNKPGAVQSSIDVSYPIDFVLGVNDFDAARIMNDIFGGGGTGRLFMNLREDKSWTYGVYANLSPDENIGRFDLTAGRGSAASVKQQATDSAVYEVLNEMRKIMNEPVTEKELSSAVKYRIGSFSRSLEDPATIANFAINIEKYNLPKNYYKDYLKRLEAITLADVQAAANKYLKPDNAWIVVTADKQYAEALTQFSPEGKVQWYDMNANPVEAPSAQDINITGEQVIENYIKAMGGREAIDAVNDYQITAEMEMMGNKVNVNQFFKKPNLYSLVMEMSGMTLQKIVFDGTTIRMSGMQGSQELTEGPEFDSVVESATVCPQLNYVASGYTLSVEGIESINGSDAYAVKITKGDVSRVEYYDIASGLNVRTVQTQESPMGAMQIVVDQSDFRTIDGIKFPFVQKQSVMGQTMETKVLSVELNKGIDNSVFQ